MRAGSTAERPDSLRLLLPFEILPGLVYKNAEVSAPKLGKLLAFPGRWEVDLYENTQRSSLHWQSSDNFKRRNVRISPKTLVFFPTPLQRVP